MERTDTDIDRYLAELPDDVRHDMVAIDAIASDVFADHGKALYVGKFWGGSDQEIIGYAPHMYRRPNGTEVDWFVVGLAVQKNYLSMYISAVEGREYLSEKYGPDLGKVKVGKSSISFHSVDDLDLDAVRSLFARARELSVDALD